MMMLILYRAMQISFFLSFRNAKLVNVFVCHSLWSKSSRSLGCSHRGQLQRQPSWKWWYRPGTVCFCLKAFRLLQNRNVPCLRYLSLPFFPTIFLAFPCLSHANSLICKPKKTSVWMRGGGWRDELPAKEVVPPYSTYTSSALHPIVSLSSPAHLNKLAPLGVFCACACARMQKHTHVHAHSHSCKHLAMQARYGRMAARILCPVLSRHADTWSRTHTSSDVLIHFNASATTITHARFKANTLHWLVASY